MDSAFLYIIGGFFLFAPLHHTKPFTLTCSGQRMLEDFEGHSNKEAKRRDDLLDKFNRQSHILFDVKSGVEHLADKLSHLKAVSRICLLFNTTLRGKDNSWK